VANTRELALQTLIEILNEGAYSNRALNEQIEKNKLTDQEKNFMTEIVYGTLQHYQLLEFYAMPYFKGRIKGWIKTLVAMTLYQIIFLDRVPEHAAISEAVNVARKRGGEFNGKLVNAILREIRRHSWRDIQEVSNEQERLAIQTSHPLWLIRLWWKQYGEQKTKAMAVANNERVLVTLRVNTLKGTRAELMKRLEAEGVQCKVGNISEDALIVLKGNAVKTKAFEEGWFYIQDEASMLVALALDPKPNTKILDTCSAPGGKTTHIAQRLNQTGRVYAHDIHQHKIKLIHENVTRLGLKNVEVSLQDATSLVNCYNIGSFDAILVDAPCSGLGILRRHPEVKITKQPADIDQIIEIQKGILKAVAPLVKVGGKLVYSTCTVNRKENDKQIEQFINNHPEFSLDETLAQRMPESLADTIKSGMVQIFPDEFKTDGFFIATLTKIR